LTLVIGRASRVKRISDDRRLERRVIPEIERIYRLNVVVTVDEDGRGFRAGVAPLTVDDGMTPRWIDGNLLQADAPHVLGQPLGGALHIAPMFGKRTDAGDSKKLDEPGKL